MLLSGVPDRLYDVVNFVSTKNIFSGILFRFKQKINFIRSRQKVNTDLSAS